jgi:hypothetical protein
MSAGLARPGEWIEDACPVRGDAEEGRGLRRGMKQLVVALWVCWGIYCPDNVAPLAFGMTPAEVSMALGVPLVYYSGAGGSEIYIAYGSPGIPGFYPSDSALALQFRNGQLSGWKKDWRLRRPWPF